MSFASGSSSNFPKFGVNKLDIILRAVDFPIPFRPRIPVTRPNNGEGRE